MGYNSKKYFSFFTLTFFLAIFLLLFFSKPVTASIIHLNNYTKEIINSIRIECYAYSREQQPRQLTPEEIEKGKKVQQWKQEKGFLIYPLYLLLTISFYAIFAETRQLKYKYGVWGIKRRRAAIDELPPSCLTAFIDLFIGLLMAYAVTVIVVVNTSMTLLLSVLTASIFFNILYFMLIKYRNKKELESTYASVQISKKINYSDKIKSTSAKKDGIGLSNPSIAQKTTSSEFSSITDMDLLRIALAVAISDDKTDDEEIETIANLFSKNTAMDIKPEITKQMSLLKSQKNPLQFILATTSIPRDKTLLKKLVDIAGADGYFSEGEKTFLLKLARKVGVSEKDLQEMFNH